MSTREDDDVDHFGKCITGGFARFVPPAPGLFIVSGREWLRVAAVVCNGVAYRRHTRGQEVRVRYGVLVADSENRCDQRVKDLEEKVNTPYISRAREINEKNRVYKERKKRGWEGKSKKLQKERMRGRAKKIVSLGKHEE